jgi:hypothetical protein
MKDLKEDGIVERKSSALVVYQLDFVVFQVKFVVVGNHQLLHL